MSADRFVREVSSTGSLGNELKRLSSFNTAANIVLLGDPGSGKTHLFQELANAPDAAYFRVRTFLNRSLTSTEAKKTLFIDGLDERRSNRGDQTAIDELLKQLFVVSPASTRISCRAADWLGETDLAVLRDYFDENGGCVVLNLERLDEDQILEVLDSSKVPNGRAFIESARQKGLEDLLGNPQTLLMLASVVEQGKWPETRKDLYEKATSILLNEHGENRDHLPNAKYSADELRDAAGSLLVTRLVADIESISISEKDFDDESPSYRKLALKAPELALAAMTRKVFVVNPGSQTADYVHRTIAEYLAAEWLAKALQGGLPISRVKSLLGVDGEPAPGLRGLHAWLAVHSPENARTMIAADPYGVLLYSDVKALTPGLRQDLLHALAEYSHSSPWFIYEEFDASSIGALSGTDMTEAFGEILSSTDNEVSLRILVLKALAQGDSDGSLVEAMKSILLNSKAAYAERQTCIEALENAGVEGLKSLASAYGHLAVAGEELRVRARILRVCYGQTLKASHFVELARDVLSTKKVDVIGYLWDLSDDVGDDEIVAVLGALSSMVDAGCSEDEGGKSEFLHEFDRLLLRALKTYPDTPPKIILKWLDSRRMMSRSSSSEKTGEIRSYLASNARLISSLRDLHVEELRAKEEPWQFLERTRGIFLSIGGDEWILERLVVRISEVKSRPLQRLLFELSTLLLVRNAGGLNKYVDVIAELTLSDRGFKKIWNQYCYAELDGWQYKNALLAQSKKREKEKTLRKTRRDFDKHVASIRSGGHVNFLTYIAKMYFGRTFGRNQESLAAERLVTEFGKKRAGIAIEGLIAFVEIGAINKPAEIIRLRAENLWREQWMTTLAGLDEYWNMHEGIDEIELTYLDAALVIQCLHPVHETQNNLTTRKKHPWLSAFIENHPKRAANLYGSLAKASLTSSWNVTYGIDELLADEHMGDEAVKIALMLLRNFPLMQMGLLRLLISVVMSANEAMQLLDLSRSSIRIRAVPVQNKVYWQAAGYLLDESTFEKGVSRFSLEKKKAFVWAVRWFLGESPRSPSQKVSLSTSQTENIIKVTQRVFPYQYDFHSGGGGDMSDWSGSEFARKLINDLSSDVSEAAIDSLRRISDSADAESYSHVVRNAIAQQHRLVIESRHCRQNWSAVVQALGNGTPTSTSDLHAVVIEHLNDLQDYLAAANIDAFKRCWNEDSHGRICTPKSEESCRDYLVELLNLKVRAMDIRFEPEGHMAKDKRVDMVGFCGKFKSVTEIKRHYHKEVWTAMTTQLDKLYTPDPEADGFGIYLVLWFGDKAGKKMPLPAPRAKRPSSANELRNMLRERVPIEKKNRLATVVLDVSGGVD